MAFSPGDRVHVASLGTGIVRDVRNRERYVVEVKGRSLVVDGRQLQSAEPRRRPRGGRTTAAEAHTVDPDRAPAARSTVRSLDLHGKTVPEATQALDVFLNDALLAGDDRVRVIHGRSGTRLKAAVHERLAQLHSIRAFHVDPRNSGVTIVLL